MRLKLAQIVMILLPCLVNASENKASGNLCMNLFGANLVRALCYKRFPELYSKMEKEYLNTNLSKVEKYCNGDTLTKKKLEKMKEVKLEPFESVFMSWSREKAHNECTIEHVKALMGTDKLYKKEIEMLLNQEISPNKSLKERDALKRAP